MNRLLITLLLAALAFLPAVDAAADDHNHARIRHGQLAMGMSGAVVATPGDPETTFYNPAALSLLGGSRLSGSLMFFGDDRRLLTDGLRARDLNPRNTRSAAFLARPSSTVFTHSFARGGTVAVSSFLVGETDELFGGELSLADAAGGDVGGAEFYALRRNRDREVWLGPSWALAPTPTFAIGVSAFYVRRDRDSTLASGFVEQTGSDGGALFTSFFDSNTGTQTRDGSFVARFGFWAQPHRRLAIGLAATSPSVRIHGRGRVKYLFAFSGNPASPDPGRQVPTHLDFSDSDLRSQSLQPASLSLGVAVPTERVRIEVDGRVDFGRRYDRMELDDAALLLVRNHYSNEVDHRLVANGALGIDAELAAHWRLRAGAFTDLSSAPPIPADPDQIMAPHVDRFGGSIAAAFEGTRGVFSVGAEVSTGRGHDVVLRDVSAVWAPEFVRVQRRELAILVFAGGIVQFAQEAAGAIIERHRRRDDPSR